MRWPERRHYHVAAVVSDTGNLERDLTGNEIAAPARIAVAAVAAVPANANPLPLCPSSNAWTDRVNDSGDLVPWDARVLNARPGSLLGHGITMANSTSFTLMRTDRRRVRDFAFSISMAHSG